MEIQFTLDTIDSAAKVLIEKMAGFEVIALHGEMGAGKTTLVTHVAALMGSLSTPSSPTFSIINEYALSDNGRMFHIDLYRLKNESEAVEAGVEDCLLSGSLCIVEWPEIAPNILPVKTLHCTLNRVSEYERILQINL